MPRAPSKLAFAKQMRRAPTWNERALWKLLRDRKLEGLRFRRQVPLGKYIADFVCLQRRLIIEADGPTARRPDGVLAAILAAARAPLLKMP
jgi:very-short-patch-repair endonuclease